MDAFGADFFDSEGRLDRKQMARKVFGDDEARRTIESILHPLIHEAEGRLLEKIARENPSAVVVVEIPLLVEGRRADQYDGVILVTAPTAVRILRLVESGRYDYDEAVARMAHQTADEERKKLADWTVDNSRSMDETTEQVKKIYRSLVGKQ